MTIEQCLSTRQLRERIKTKEYQRMKEKARDPGTIQRFKRLENNARDKLTKLSEIDKGNLERVYLGNV